MAEQPPAGSPRVLLASVPWTNVNEPSLGLAVLKAVLNDAAVPCRIRHLNLLTLDFLNADTYAALARVYALNDFVFSGVLDPQVTPKQLRLLREKCAELVGLGTIDHRRHGGIPGIVDQILRLRSQVIPQWVDSQARDLLRWEPSLVGFTCMFDQTIASAAIASRVKSYDPGVLIALGGYAVRPPTADMLLDAFPWIDAICVGEGEPAILPLALASAALSPDLSGVPNIYSRDTSGAVRSGPRAPLVAMDRIPAPDFDDFFDDVRELRVEHDVEIAIDRLPLENSRGCWWGATHHCVFCGISDDDMGYRARSAESALAVLAQVSERYDFAEFRFADYILPHQYYSTLLPQLAAAGTPYRLKGELKANINEKRARLLAEAGFVEVQPGIESFSGSMLSAMDKGVTGVQNAFLLLLGRRLGIVVLYNLLYGLPGEDPEATEAMVSRLPSLRHLDPPSTRGRIQVTRYAPLQTDGARFGFGALRHERSYDLIFSEDYLRSTGFDLDRYCYTFELPFEPAPRLARAYREIDRLCDEWSEEDQRRDIELLYTPDDRGGLAVHDSRVLPAKDYHLNATEAALLQAAERPRSTASLRTELSAYPPGEVEAALEKVRALGLVFEDEDQIVSLALPRAEVVARRHWWDNYSTRWSRTLTTTE